MHFRPRKGFSTSSTMSRPRGTYACLLSLFGRNVTCHCHTFRVQVLSGLTQAITWTAPHIPMLASRSRSERLSRRCGKYSSGSRQFSSDAVTIPYHQEPSRDGTTMCDEIGSQELSRHATGKTCQVHGPHTGEGHARLIYFVFV